DLDELRDTRQRPFRALVACFKRAIEDEVLSEWVKRHLVKLADLPKPLAQERNYLEDYDFDLRTVAFMEELSEASAKSRERDWLRAMNRAKEVGAAMDKLGEDLGGEYQVLIDRIDESWDGSDKAVIFLMALMHACLELAASVMCFRPLLFLR